MNEPKIPPYGYDEIIATYGDPTRFVSNPGVWEAKILDAFELPFSVTFGGARVTHMRAHKLAVPVFKAVFADIKAAGLTELVQEFNGLYAFRTKMTNHVHLSTHVWGIAIDLNASKFPLGSTARQDGRLIDIFVAHGFTYGGDFHGTKDGMHWQLAGGY